MLSSGSSFTTAIGVIPDNSLPRESMTRDLCQQLIFLLYFITDCYPALKSLNNKHLRETRGPTLWKANVSDAEERAGGARECYKFTRIDAIFKSYA